MIKFALRCSAGHVFDSWFRDNDSFDQLKSNALVACPTCGSSEVAKALMAPAVVTSRNRSERSAQPAEPMPVATPPQAAPVLQDEKAQMFRAMLRDMRDHLIQNSKNVGAAFAEEARRIHDGASDESAIHGVASPDDVKALIEDGIEIMPLPVFPDERN